MHVGGLAVFNPPDGASAADMRAMFDTALAGNQVAPPFRKRARRSVTSLGQWGWDHLPHDEVDLEHHVRRDARRRRNWHRLRSRPAPTGSPRPTGG